MTPLESAYRRFVADHANKTIGGTEYVFGEGFMAGSEQMEIWRMEAIAAQEGNLKASAEIIGLRNELQRLKANGREIAVEALKAEVPRG